MDGNFDNFWYYLLLNGTRSCLERDVLRNLKSALRDEYQKVLIDADKSINEIIEQKNNQ